jgi:hypothetical protein
MAARARRLRGHYERSLLAIWKSYVVVPLNSHEKYVSTLHGEKMQVLVLKHVVHIVTTVL